MQPPLKYTVSIERSLATATQNDHLPDRFVSHTSNMGSVEPASASPLPQTSTAATLPVINISNPDQATATQLVDAASRHGFLYIDTRGTGLTPALVSRQFALSRRFFSRPDTEKNEVLITAKSENQGWTGWQGEILDPKNSRQGDFKEALNMKDFILEGELGVWRSPEESLVGSTEINPKSPKEYTYERVPSDYKVTLPLEQSPLPTSIRPYHYQLQDFDVRCKKLTRRILYLFGLGLAVEPPTFFSDRHTEPSCTVRLLHYPPIPEGSDYDPAVDVRAGAHSDYGSVTLLFQRPGQAGLEIRVENDDVDKSDGDGERWKWVPVPVIPEGYTPERSSSPTWTPDGMDDDDTLPPILVNIGDLLSYWTNGLLRSTVHRVVMPKEPSPQGQSSNGNPSANRGEHRYSIAYFGHPNDDTELVPVPSEVVRRWAAWHDDNGENGDKSHSATNGEAAEIQVGYGGGATGKRAMTAREHLQNRLKATYGFAGAKGEAEARIKAGE